MAEMHICHTGHIRPPQQGVRHSEFDLILQSVPLSSTALQLLGRPPSELLSMRR